MLDQHDIFYNEITTWMDEVRAAVIIYLNSNKALNNASHNILTGKLASVAWISGW